MSVNNEDPICSNENPSASGGSNQCPLGAFTKVEAPVVGDVVIGRVGNCCDTPLVRIVACHGKLIVVAWVTVKSIQYSHEFPTMAHVVMVGLVLVVVERESRETVVVVPAVTPTVP